LDKTNVRNPIWEKPHCLESYNSNFLDQVGSAARYVCVTGEEEREAGNVESGRWAAARKAPPPDE
jgi:hypothetical protein